LQILRVSKHSQKLKLAHDFYSYCFVRSLVIAHAAFAMSKSILTYFKPVGNRNGQQQVKLPDPTGPLTEELPSSVISAANKDIIESSKKESSKKTKGPYAKFTPEFKAKIAKYAIENGNCAAARKEKNR